MAKKPFMEMDIDEFEDKNEEVIDEPNLDFDFDEDVEEITPDTDSLSETPSDDNSLEIPEFHKEFIESGKAKKYDGMVLGDEAGMIKIGRFLNIDEIPAEQKKVNETYKNLTSPENGEIIKVIPVATADSDPDYSDGEMDDYIVLYKYKDTFRYAVLQTSTNPDHIGLFAFAHDVNGLESSYDFWSKHQIVSKDSSVDSSSTDDSSETPEIPEEPEVTQEGMFDAGFGNLRSRLADALKDKFKVTNVGPGGIGGNSKFEIMEPDAKFDSMKTTVESTGTGCKVVTRGGGKFKCNFMNIPLSQAFDKIKALFDKPELLLENALYNISRFDNRIYQESDEDEDEIPELPEELDINDDDTSTDDAKEESDTTEKDDETKDDSDDEDSDDKEQFLTYEELDKNFGSDDSDVQNDYDPNDIEILNKLISGESEAINDYFDGSKDSKDENLRTLFSDIGHEERFHLEQLLYAKSQLTGEKYEPRDPQVKAEYEELINGGMDEESAAFTAMDKASMLGEDDGDDSDMEELEQESAIVYNMLYHNEVMTSICEQHVSNPINTDNNIAVFVEGYIMESIDNVGSAPKSKTDIKSPFAILANGLKLAITGISKMSTVARDAMRRSNLKRTRRKEWLQNHGIGDLFKGGVHLYLWNDKTSQMDFDTPCKYVDFLYRLTKAIGESCGVKLTAAAQHKTIQNPIKFKTVDDGMYALSQVLFTKTKVVVTEENKAALQNEFFGYSDSKINVKVTHDDSGQAVNDSNNIYNKMEAMLLVIQRYTEISKAVLDELAKLEGDVNSVYYKNRPVYNKARTNMSKVINKYNQFISAIAADMTQIIKLNNGLLEMTRERDMTEQSGGKWEGPDVRVSPKTQPQGTKYTKVKKR